MDIELEFPRLFRLVIPGEPTFFFHIVVGKLLSFSVMWTFSIFQGEDSEQKSVIWLTDTIMDEVNLFSAPPSLSIIIHLLKAVSSRKSVVCVCGKILRLIPD